MTAKLPDGTVRIHHGRRMIKRAGRWVCYARALWEVANGPVPPGCKVIHLDGDTLNDDPANLAALPMGDVSYLSLERTRRRPSRKTRRRAKARHDRLRRKALAVLRQLVPASFYAVDEAARSLTGPFRVRKQARAWLGVSPDSPPLRGPVRVGQGRDLQPLLDGGYSLRDPDAEASAG